MYFGVDEFEATSLIQCLFCHAFLGRLKDKKYYLLADYTIKKQRSIRLAYVGLNENEINEVADVIAKVAADQNIQTVKDTIIIKKAELSSFNAKLIDSNVQGLVIVHKHSGRLLLTDDNGLYEKVIEVCSKQKSRPN